MLLLGELIKEECGSISGGWVMQLNIQCWKCALVWDRNGFMESEGQTALNNELGASTSF